jgi:hypothetical protein
MVLSEAQVVITGGSAATTVTEKSQLGPAFAEQVTMVVPTGNAVPEGGEQVTGSQVPVVVGAG